MFLVYPASPALNAMPPIHRHARIPSTVTPAFCWAGVSCLLATVRSMREMPD